MNLNVTTAPDAPPRALSTTALLALLSCGFLATYNFGSVNVALPAIGASLRTSHAWLELIMGGYAMCLAALLILGGRLGDAFGRRRVLLIGMIAFALITSLTALAPDVTGIVVLRCLQGAASALTVPQVLAVIQATTAGQARVRAVGMFGGMAGFGGGVGMVVGGVLAATGPDGWRLTLWVAVAISVVALPGVALVPETREQQRPPLDPVGVALLGTLILAVLVPITLGPGTGWPLWTLLVLVVSLPLLGALVWWERRYARTARIPVLPGSVLGMRPMQVGLICTGIFFAGYGAFMYEYALATQSGLGYSALRSGVSLGSFALSFLVVSLLSGRLPWSAATTLRNGCLGQAAALLVLATAVAAGWPSPSVWLMQFGLLLLGASQALIFGPLVQSVMAQVPAHIAGLSGGLFSTTQQLFLAVGVAAYGAVFTVAAAHLGFGAAFAIGTSIQAASALTILLLTRLSTR